MPTIERVIAGSVRARVSSSVAVSRSERGSSKCSDESTPGVLRAATQSVKSNGGSVFAGGALAAETQ
jgi:hypothetical protein